MRHRGGGGGWGTSACVRCGVSQEIHIGIVELQNFKCLFQPLVLYAIKRLSPAHKEHPVRGYVHLSHNPTRFEKSFFACLYSMFDTGSRLVQCMLINQF